MKADVKSWIQGGRLQVQVDLKGDLPGHPFRGNQWSGGRGSGSVLYVKDARERLNELIGDVGENAEMLGSLFGAEGKGELKIQPFDLGDGKGVMAEYEDKEVGVYWQTSIMRAEGKTKLEIMGAGVVDKGKGTATRIAFEQVTAAKKLGIDEVELNADRSPTMNGYYTWARLGFEGSIPAAWKSRYARHPAVASMRGPSVISNLLKTESGRKLWKDKGETIRLYMDLKNRPYQYERLAEYARAKAAASKN